MEGVKSLVQIRAEAESNISPVTLRAAGGDENGSLKYDETVKYGREKDCAGKGQQHIK
jgi:hypothetical protein